MSNYLAVAAVTETLRYTLQSAVRGQPGAPGGVTVTTGRPTDPAAGTGPAINIFLYQVTPNPSWRNNDVPTRDAEGRILQRPRAAIDLHYLLSFYGEDVRQDAQQLLGIAVVALHSQPTLTRDQILAAKRAATRNFLRQSNLEDSIELVRFTQSPLDLEALSKLWSVFFQTPYALSVGYQGSVVLVETEDVPLPVLPVLERNVYAIPIRQPVIDQIAPADGLGWPIVPGSEVVIQGENLLAPAGQATKLLIDGTDLLASAQTATNTSITIQLQRLLPAPLPAGTTSVALDVGVHTVLIQHEMAMGMEAPPHAPKGTPGTHVGPASNLAAFVLQPHIVGPVSVSNLAGAGTPLRSADLSFSVDPALKNGDTVAVMLMSLGTGDPVPPISITVPPLTTPPAPQPPPPANPLTVHVADVLPGDYYVQVQVNGITSPIERDPNPPRLFTGPKVSFP